MTCATLISLYQYSPILNEETNYEFTLYLKDLKKKTKGSLSSVKMCFPMHIRYIYESKFILSVLIATVMAVMTVLTVMTVIATVMATAQQPSTKICLVSITVYNLG